jgi:hypothetical protein
MKKYLMIGAAACLLGGAMLTSCSSDKDLYDGAKEAERNAENLLKDYAANFQKVFGEIAPDQTWGFGAPAGARATRSITVNGDVYDKFPSAEEVDANFPTAIPADADEVADLETLYKGQKVQTQYGEQTMWELYHIYAYKIVEGYNLKITQAGTTEVGGSYQNVTYENNASVAHPYNLYVNVPNGKVTIKRNGSTHFNLYVLSGEVTLESDYGEQAGIISVAPGATVIDQRNSIAANQGVKIFNRGTFNATNPENYDIGNFCTFYNEGKFTATGALTYSPGMANTSYFMNLGDEAEVIAPEMTLNSAGNFFNSGKVNITGETNVTQKNIYWVNAGHYTTGSIEFSAWNSTFYNYCQLIVKGKAHMFDGQFNLMEDSYTEAGSAEMDNFAVNMGSNTGMYIKGNLRLLGQGDGSFQGFRTEGTNDYLLVDGKAIVDCHKYTFSISNGITYSINAIEIVRGIDGTEVVTEQQLQDEQSGDLPVLDLKGTECPYGELTVTPNTNSCGATWKKNIPTPPSKPFLRVIAEDLTTKEKGDFDFNDIVFDVEYVSATQAKVTILAAGGTLPLTINGQEVHQLFITANPNATTDQGGPVNTQTMINTNAQRINPQAPYSSAELTELPTLTLTGSWSDDQEEFSAQVRDNIPLVVTKTNEDGTTYTLTLTAEMGKAPGKVGIASPYYEWKQEKVYIGDNFKKFVSDPTYAMWWKE